MKCFGKGQKRITFTFGVWLYGGLTLALASILDQPRVMAVATTDAAENAPLPDDSPSESTSPLRPQTSCPTELEPLTTLLLRDIPSYSNRVLQRSIGEVRRDLDEPAISQYRPPYVLIASQPELAPLNISEQVYTTAIDAQTELQQVFFSTLERQYTNTEVNNIELLHWLFLAPAEEGWHLAFMFSTIDDGDPTTSVLPPRESSNSGIGKAVQLWLRDCRTGTIKPLE